MDENTNQHQERILPLELEKEMRESFISYAMAVIINRALPDVRDGLKPVHRRILYSMAELGLQPEKSFRKSARIVGDCLGKYHPHGDSSVYDAMVRLAQDFSTRYPLVHGHGNFGSVDGDEAAAMRYTEAKLSKLSVEMLRDIEKETVDFVPNFDETEMQPSVLPSRFPNLLVNGSGGIAVGMATNIPPHNLGEIIDACIAMIDDPDISVHDLINIVPGPDFPTGAIIMGTSGIHESYANGRGKIVVRARCEIDTFAANRSRIIVTELPFQVNKARLVEKIAELVNTKRIDGITALRDESGRDGMRIVIELRKDINANVMLNHLYKHTQLQDTFGVINLALVDGEPKILSLKQMISHYLDHQIDVVTRRTRYELSKAEAREHLLQGLMIALDNIDEVIRIIRGSKNDPEARTQLQNRFGLSEKQSQAILDMRLRRLTGLERDKILDEFNALTITIARLKEILTDRSLLMGTIKEELSEIKRRFADERRTEIQQNFDDIDIEDLIEVEDMAVTMTHFGYIKRTSSATYKSQRRGGTGVSGAQVREEDFVEHLFVTSTHTPIIFFTNRGRAFTIKCYQIPESGRNAKGTAIVNLLQLSESEKVTACFPLDDEKAKYLVLCTRHGVIKKTLLSDFSNIRRGGLIAQTLRDDDELISVLTSTGNDEFIIATAYGKSIRFNENGVRPMGRAASGVKSIALSADDRIVGLNRIDDSKEVLTITEFGMGKRSEASEYRLQRRGGKGVSVMSLTEKTGLLSSLHVISPDSNEDLMLIRDDGTIIRMPVEGIRKIGRNTKGVKLMRVDDGMRVVSSAIIPTEDEEPDDDEVLISEDASENEDLENGSASTEGSENEAEKHSESLNSTEESDETQ